MCEERKVRGSLGLGLGDWVSVKEGFGWRIREVPCLQIQGEIYTHSELLRTSGVRRGVGVNESVKKGLHLHTVHIRSRSRGSCFLGGPRRLLGAAEGDGHKALGAE